MTDEQPIPKLDEIPSHDELGQPQPTSPAEVVKPNSPPPVNKSPQQPKLSRMPRLNWDWKRWALLALGLLIIGGIVFFIFFYRASVSVTTSPTSATIQIDDIQTTGSLEEKFYPGDHLLKISSAGFIPYEEQLHLRINDRRDLAVTLRELPAPIPLSANQQVQFVVFDQNRESLLYLAPEEKRALRLFPRDLDNPVIDPVTPAALENITAFIWSPDRQLAFFKLPANVTKQYDFKRYDLVNQEINDWPAGVGSIDWRPDGQKVAYYFSPEGGEKTLIRANRDNADPERIFNFAETEITDPEVAWSPDAKYISVLTDRLYLLDVFSKELKPIIEAESVKEVRWLPNSSGLVYITNQGQLKLTTIEGEITDFSLSASLDQVALFSNSEGLVFVRGRGNSTEINYLDFATREVMPYVFAPTPNLAPRNLLLNDQDDTLFFTSAGELFALPLDRGEYVSPPAEIESPLPTADPIGN